MDEKQLGRLNSISRIDDPENTDRGDKGNRNLVLDFLGKRDLHPNNQNKEYVAVSMYIYP